MEELCDVVITKDVCICIDDLFVWDERCVLVCVLVYIYDRVCILFLVCCVWCGLVFEYFFIFIFKFAPSSYIDICK